MTIDFRAEVDKRKDDLMEDLFGLLRINSERDDSKVDEQHPFGPGPVKALEHFLALAKRDGYKTRNIDNYAGDFEFGHGDEVLGIFAHLDVVQAGSGWDSAPYEPVIKDGKLYARGSSDDKGPTMACYYALKIIKELNLPVSKRVRFIVGTDEESGWDDMAYYFAHNGLKDPDFGFSPDAEFPIINGKSVHCMMPQKGINGATYLALFLSQFDFQGNAEAYLNVIAETLHKDFFGEKVGLAYTDPKMGELTMNAGVFHFNKESEDNTIALNFRYPQGVDVDGIKAGLEKLEGPKEVTLSEHGHIPHYVPVSDPMVQTLLSVYEKHTGLKGEEQIIGGGTFGRLLKRGVAYGAMFPGYVNTMHQANEFTEVEDLYRAAAIYAEAIYELIK